MWQKIVELTLKLFIAKFNELLHSTGRKKMKHLDETKFGVNLVCNQQIDSVTI